MRARHRHTNPREYAGELNGFERRLLAGLAAVVEAAGEREEEAAAPPAPRGGRPAGALAWRVRLVTAAAVAAALAVAVQVAGIGPAAVRDRAGGGAPASAAELGARAADAARSGSGPTLEPGQWLYVRYTLAHDAGVQVVSDHGKDELVAYAEMPPRTVELWAQAAPRSGWAAKVVPDQAGPAEAATPQAGTSREERALRLSPLALLPPRAHPTLADLPTDPDRLLRVIYRVAERDRAAFEPLTASTDHLAFRLTGDLLGGLMAPPALQAALFEAMARIPGVIVVPDATDAAGRHGIALARVENGVRAEVILDRATYRYLGAALIVITALDAAPASPAAPTNLARSGSPAGDASPRLALREGQVLYRSAQIAHAMVDAPPQRPPGAAAPPEEGAEPPGLPVP